MRRPVTAADHRHRSGRRICAGKFVLEHDRSSSSTGAAPPQQTLRNVMLPRNPSADFADQPSRTGVFRIIYFISPTDGR